MNAGTEKASPQVAYGRLLESAHFSSYGFERLCDSLEWLLKDDRWRQLGDWGINEFLATIDLSSLNLGSKRPKLIKRIKELQPDASQRAIAKAVGVDQATVSRDLADADASDGAAKSLKHKDAKSESDANASPLWLAKPASETADKIRAAVQIAETRKAGEDKRKADLERPVDIELPDGIIHGDFYELSRSIPGDSVDLIFTDPPYDADSIYLYEQAAEVAARILKPGGSFVAYSGEKYLFDVLGACRKHLVYWWTCAVIHHEGGDQLLAKLGARCGWKPLVWYVKGTRGDVQNIVSDTIHSVIQKDDHEWQQSTVEARYFIQKLCTKDGCVVDFFLGSGTTAVAAAELGRRFIGYEINAATIERAARRIAL